MKKRLVNVVEINGKEVEYHNDEIVYSAVRVAQLFNKFNVVAMIPIKGIADEDLVHVYYKYLDK